MQRLALLMVLAVFVAACSDDVTSSPEDGGIDAVTDAGAQDIHLDPQIENRGGN